MSQKVLLANRSKSTNKRHTVNIWQPIAMNSLLIFNAKFHRNLSKNGRVPIYGHARLIWPITYLKIDIFE